MPVHFQDRALRFDSPDAVQTTTKPSIAQNRRDVAVAGEGPARELLPKYDWRLVLKTPVGRIRIQVESRIARIETQALICPMQVHHQWLPVLHDDYLKGLSTSFPFEASRTEGTCQAVDQATVWAFGAFPPESAQVIEA